MNAEERKRNRAGCEEPVLGAIDADARERCEDVECIGECDTCCRATWSYALMCMLGHIVPDDQGEEVDEDGRPLLRFGWPHWDEDELELWMEQARPLLSIFAGSQRRDQALAIILWAYGQHADPWNAKSHPCQHKWIESTYDMSGFVDHVSEGKLLAEFEADKKTPDFWLRRYFAYSPHAGCGMPWEQSMPLLLHVGKHCTRGCFDSVLRRATAWCSGSARFLQLYDLWQAIYKKGVAADPSYAEQPLGRLVNNWLITHVWSTRP